MGGEGRAGGLHCAVEGRGRRAGISERFGKGPGETAGAAAAGAGHVFPVAVFGNTAELAGGGRAELSESGGGRSADRSGGGKFGESGQAAPVHHGPGGNQGTGVRGRG